VALFHFSFRLASMFDKPRGVGDDVAILNAGRIVYDGPAEDARRQTEPLHANLGDY
jgi:hypothetical protein